MGMAEKKVIWWYIWIIQYFKDSKIHIRLAYVIVRMYQSKITPENNSISGHYQYYTLYVLHAETRMECWLLVCWSPGCKVGVLVDQLHQHKPAWIFSGRDSFFNHEEWVNKDMTLILLIATNWCQTCAGDMDKETSRIVLSSSSDLQDITSSGHLSHSRS